ncbi:DNA polymerase II large subunit [Candidatus Woesearchaeota archaeon]|jgi:DNA polymerase II large subunit|nr:DNA polymerase II large subunit [Candidatus Woesearchaeota archaeon]MBT4336016.1 DNA polymerase II large subunit [Candidatus Woesearchaeota archaeon]MBT4469005.1 DNA polymerase II large subunit [Candidatus Woesearchaeota archaeon]MBT6744676.1 DNA polymerase II large subunit [Candidatus Woesearchaeota archaeon]
MSKASPEIKKYFAVLNDEVKRSYDLAAEAHKKNLDPDKIVPIPLAKNMAERVVGLISVVAPQVLETNITDRIMELEKEYGLLDWRVGFKIAEEVAKETFCKFKDKQEAIEIGIRVGFAYLTLGIVSAPLEGFIGIKIKKRKDGKEYFALQYAGPIRAAGGTASSVSVILSDYVRVKLGYAPYDPDETEINRYNAEVHDYHERITNLQYHPSDEEVKFMVSHLPVEVDGDPTEKFEVSNFKDLPRIETNLIRGGVALVLAEGLSQKTPKLWKRLSKWGKDFGLGHWDFLKDFLDLKDKLHAEEDDGKSEAGKDEKKTVKANNTFIMDLVAGRPILTHPLAVGGFRLRYGRTRVTGFSTCALHPATMIVLNKFIAIGTQIKTERPGKAATTTVCESLEGPIVRLNNGSVKQLKTDIEAKEVLKDVEEIVFLGDILFNYGDFSENGQDLVPAGYCHEWWALEVEKAIKNLYSEDEIKKASDLLEIDPEELKNFVEKPLYFSPDWNQSLTLSKKLKVPLHPDYTFYWKLVSGKDLLILMEWFNEGKVKIDEKGIKKIIFPYDEKIEKYKLAKKTLENLGVTHQLINKENLVLARKEANIFAFCLDFKDQKGLEGTKLTKELVENKDGLEVINYICDVEIRDKAGTFIGARMGRPEKAKMRKMTGSPQVMFPVGEEGDRMRSFQAALKVGKIRNTFPHFYCTKCKKEMIYSNCEECNNECEKKYHCRFCGDLEKETCRHGDANPFRTTDIDIKYYFNKAKERIGERLHPDLIKGVRGTSNKEHVMEHLSKGILRAKHNIYVNKDGTTRYDGTEMPITHFKPREIKTSVEKLKKLGYNKDVYGNEIENDDQIIEIKPQDVILPGFNSLEESGPQVLFRVANFIDELLVKFYGLKPFYNLESEEDLVGHLVIGLAPHISAGLIGRIIGFSETQGLLTHPMYHAGMRRDCDGDEAAVLLLMDALLNFSRQYLPERRGAKTMDAPLVLTSTLVPSEVDDQVHGMDVVWKYPLELYEAALEMKKPWEVLVDGKKIEQLGDRLETAAQYENFGYTHWVNNFNKGVLCSDYKTLPTMEAKLFGQMEIAQKVRAVDMDDVAKLVIQKHFLKDIKGNLRKFSMQQFRCVGCNTKFRRPPLSGKCHECKTGKIIFTISHGSVIKYLGHSMRLAEEYNFSPYLKQTLDLLQLNVEDVFGREKEKQAGLGDFIG